MQNLIISYQNNTLIIIPEGEYNEDLTISKDIHLKADGNVTINGVGENNAMTINSNHVILEGININQKKTDYGGGITVLTGYTSIINCNVSCEFLSAITVINNANVDIVDCKISNSENPSLYIINNSIVNCYNSKITDSKSASVSIGNNAKCLLKDCEISSSEVSGLVISDESSINIEKCKIHDNNHYGIVIYSSGKVQISETEIYGNNEIGIIAKGKNITKLSNSSIYKNPSSGILLRDGATLISTNNKYKDSISNCIIHIESSSICYLLHDSI